jgi:XRE family transcriptional regulator, fatty acid utilization regulator
MAAENPKIRIGGRLKALRDGRGVSQDALAAALGLNDRQSVAAIEAGERRIRPDELVRAAEALGVDVDTFLDPFRLVGEGRFSFRTKEADPDVLAAFEERAGRWIATYRELGRQTGSEPRRLGTRLELTERSSFEEAADTAEYLWARWNLGDVPAARLEEALERELGILVLYVDAPESISGAASYLPGQHTILVNRRESPGRRSYDLAHELFHLLTWDAMPPRRVEPWEVKGTKGNRVERLAENFAAALLMPSRVLAARWSARGEEELPRWIARTAAELRVSVSALGWRLVNLGHLSRAEMDALPAKPAVRPRTEAPPLLFSRPFVARLSDAVADGRLSLRRAAALVELPPEEVAALCEAHGRPLGRQNATADSL